MIHTKWSGLAENGFTARGQVDPERVDLKRSVVELEVEVEVVEEWLK